MLRESLIFIFERDLQKVVEEVKSYKTEADLWVFDKEIANSGGNLALHLTGNIKYFFGAVLGKTGFRRKRDSEFSQKEIPRAEIIEGLENALEVLKRSLKNLPDEDFYKDFPEEFLGEKRKTIFVIIHLLSHLNYHLGQINYHRRLLSN